MHTQWKRWSRNGLWLTLTVTFNNFLYEKKCGLIIFFLLKILAKQFILKNNETVENLHKMYIDWGLFFQWIHLPITTQHINHLCVSDAFFKGTFHKYKPTNKFFWTCIVKLTTIRHLTWQAHSVRIISIWTQYHGQLYWLFCTKNPPKELRSENIQISSQIWQSTGKRIFFFRFRWQNATHLQLSSCFYHRFKEKRSWF